MEFSSSILKEAYKILFAQSQKDYKKFLKQKLLRENPNLNELQLSTKIGQINKEVKEKIKVIKSNYHQYVYKWLIQGQLPQDIDIKFQHYLQQYQYIKNNNKEHVQIPSDVLNSFSNLYNFIENYNKEHQPLNISVQKQKVRKQPLPFKHIASNGNFNMYIVEDGQYEDLNRLYGNNNNSKYGGLIATTSWCVTLDKSNFKGTYQPPYYLITEGKTAPEALVHIDSRQFKNIDNRMYDKNHPEVYKLVIDLLKSKNVIDLENDFIALFDYIQNKNQLLDDLSKNKKFDQIYTLIYFNKIKDEDQFKKAIQVLIDNNQSGQIYGLIKEDKIKDEDQFKKAIQVLIDKEKFDYLSYLIDDNKIKDKNQLSQIIQKMINNKYISNAIINKITDPQQLKDAIQIIISVGSLFSIYLLIKEDKIKDPQQLKDAIQAAINYKFNRFQYYIDNNKFYCLQYLISNNKIKDHQQLKDAIQVLIDNEKFDYLYYLIIDDTIKDENNVKYIIQAMIDNKQFDKLCELIKYNKITDQELLKKIEEAKNNANIKTSSLSKKLFDIYTILKH